MAKKKVCTKCGYINNIDNSYCDCCDEDLDACGETIELPNNSKSFFDLKNNRFVDTRLDQEFEKLEEKELEEKSIKTKKVCPTCGFENDSNTDFCSKCHTPLIVANMVEQLSKNKVSEENDCNEELLEESEINKYFIVIGKNGENTYEIAFDNNGKYYIGRDFQSCLKDENYVSRKHCRLVKEDDDIYLVDMSKNGTLYQISEGKFDILEYGVVRKLKDGDRFFLTKYGRIPVLFSIKR